MSRYSILVVSANTGWLRRMAAYFIRSGYAARTAALRDDVPRLAETIRPGCILLDSAQPTAKVAHCCALLKGDEATANIPVIIVASGAQETLQAYVNCKADGIIERGSTFIRIRAVVRGVLGHRHWERGMLVKGDLRLDAANCLLCRKSKPYAKLTPEQFRFLSLLVKKSPDFAKEVEIVSKVLSKNALPDKGAAIRVLALRLRRALGRQLARRIVNRKFAGWAYLEPRFRGKYNPQKA